MKQDNSKASKKWVGSYVSCVWEDIHDLEIFINLKH